MDQHASGSHADTELYRPPARSSAATVRPDQFVTWDLTERTLSIHTIDTMRRELFYWAAVVATFAMGTAVGDLTAVTFKLGYDYSIVLFAAMIMIPASATGPSP